MLIAQLISGREWAKEGHEASPLRYQSLDQLKATTKENKWAKGYLASSKW
jgi:hypothetical protein